MGVDASAKAKVAMLEIIMVVTNSEGWSSPNCFFPISLRENTIRKYSRTVRIVIISIFYHSFFFKFDLIKSGFSELFCAGEKKILRENLIFWGAVKKSGEAA